MPTQPATPAVTYALQFDAAAQHYVDVRAHFTAVPAQQTMQLRLPAWTPGSYMIREYARHIEAVQAQDAAGVALQCEKTGKDTWQLQVVKTGDVTVSYRVYGRELTVRTNYVDADFALLQGAATCLYWPEAQHRPHAWHVNLPQSWQSAICGLVGTHRGQEHVFVAQDYDELVDSPLLLGNPRVRNFLVDNKEHVFASVGGEALFDDDAAAAEAKRVVEINLALWGTLPYARYAFMNLLLDGRGGLEHRHSSVLMASPWTHNTQAMRADFHGLVAHEHFHVWNIKRLRPKALGPFDYGQEAYTPSLWIAEGLTAYYDDLQICRAKLISPSDYLARLSSSIETLHKTPGRHLTPLTASSQDAWIKLYRRDENTDNTTVSYYLKGSLVGLLLDAHIRLHTGNKQSLDDVMRAAYAEFGGAVGYEEQQFRDLLLRFAGPQLASVLAQMVDGTDELDYGVLLQAYGVELLWQAPKREVGRLDDADGIFGASLKDAGGNAIVTRVQRGSPAYAAGIHVDDEIIAIGEQRLAAKQLYAWLRHKSGSQVEVLLARFGQLRRIVVPIAQPQLSCAKLQISADATPAQQQALALWLGARAVTATSR